MLDMDDFTFGALKDRLPLLYSKYAPGAFAEGIVFHHQRDGRRAKIKRSDFLRAV